MLHVQHKLRSVEHFVTLFCWPIYPYFSLLKNVAYSGYVYMQPNNPVNPITNVNNLIDMIELDPTEFF